MGDFDAWLATLDEVSRILRVPSARTIFLSPTVQTPQKAAALERLVPKATPIMRNFLRILIDRDRLAEVSGIAEALRGLINERRGIITAEVTTAVPLDPELERLVARRLAERL